MQKHYFLLLLLCLFVSCSKQIGDEFQEGGTMTVREIISDFNNETLWVKELEENRLSKNITYNEDFFNQNLNISSPEFLMAYGEMNKKVFPEILNFSSLDISDLSSFQLQFIKNFLTSFKENKISAGTEFMNSDFIFNYVFFLKDIQEFPLICNFNDYNIGSPFIKDKILEVPVLLYCENEKYQINLFIELSEKLSILNIQLLKVGGEVWSRVN